MGRRWNCQLSVYNIRAISNPRSAGPSIQEQIQETGRMEGFADLRMQSGKKQFAHLLLIYHRSWKKRYYYILFNPCDSKQCYSSLSIRAISNPRSPGMQESIQAARMEGLGEHIRCRFLDIISLLIYSHPLSSYVCGVGRRGMLLFLSIITYMRDLDAVLHTLPEQFSSNTCAELQEKSGSTTLFLPRT